MAVKLNRLERSVSNFFTFDIKWCDDSSGRIFKLHGSSHCTVVQIPTIITYITVIFSHPWTVSKLLCLMRHDIGGVWIRATIAIFSLFTVCSGRIVMETHTNYLPYGRCKYYIFFSTFYSIEIFSCLHLCTYQRPSQARCYDANKYFPCRWFATKKTISLSFTSSNCAFSRHNRPTFHQLISNCIVNSCVAEFAIKKSLKCK